MSEKVIEKPEISVGLESNTRLFDIVGFAQEKYRSQHFCSCRAVVKDYHLTFEPCEYRAPLREQDIPNHVLSLNGTVFEHFLQSVRKNLAVSFMDVFVQATEGWQSVKFVDPCKKVVQEVA